MFTLLRTVSGVGPTSALAICSIYNPSDFARIIATGDDAALKMVKGIGKRTAERIIVDLKSKVAKFAVSGTADDGTHAASGQATAASQDGSIGTVVQALVELGFPEKDAESSARSAAKSGGSVSTILKRALQALSSERA